MIVSLSDSLGERLTFGRWMSKGTLIALTGCSLATLAILLAVRMGWM